MGLDVIILTDNHNVIYNTEYHADETFFYLHSLSRTFCNLMNREDAAPGEPELKQIGRIAGVDVSPFYNMNLYTEEGGDVLEFFLSMAKSEEERQRMIQEAEENNKRLERNIDLVVNTTEALLTKLPAIGNLPELLTDNGFDTLNNKV